MVGITTIDVSFHVLIIAFKKYDFPMQTLPSLSATGTPSTRRVVGRLKDYVQTHLNISNQHFT